MKNILIILLIFTNVIMIKTEEEIQLNEPQISGGMPLFEAIKNRRSKRNFVDAPLADELLSQALWMCYGINEAPDKRTVPASCKFYSFVDYVFLKSGIYRYNYSKHSITKIKDGDHRDAVTVKYIPTLSSASLILCQVIDFEYEGAFTKFDKNVKRYIASIDSGMCADGLSLLASSRKMQNVIIGGFNNTKIISNLGIDPERYEVNLCFALGFDHIVTQENFINCIKNQVGKISYLDTEGPDSFDNSGLPYYCFDYQIPRNINNQFKEGKPVDILQPGDLMFWDLNNSGKPDDVTVCMGNNIMIHASKNIIKYKKYWSNTYTKSKFLGAKRYW